MLLVIAVALLFAWHPGVEADTAFDFLGHMLGALVALKAFSSRRWATTLLVGVLLVSAYAYSGIVQGPQWTLNLVAGLAVMSLATIGAMSLGEAAGRRAGPLPHAWPHTRVTLHDAPTRGTSS